MAAKTRSRSWEYSIKHGIDLQIGLLFNLCSDYMETLELKDKQKIAREIKISWIASYKNGGKKKGMPNPYKYIKPRSKYDSSTMANSIKLRQGVMILSEYLRQVYLEISKLENI